MIVALREVYRNYKFNKTRKVTNLCKEKEKQGSLVYTRREKSGKREIVFRKCYSERIRERREK